MSKFNKVIPKLRREALLAFEEGLKNKGIEISSISQKVAFANGFNACYKKLRSINKIRKYHEKNEPTREHER